MLKDRNLTYYKMRQKSKNFRGRMVIQRGSKVYTENDHDDRDNRFVFQVETNEGVLTARAENDLDFEIWVSYIRKVAQVQQVPVSSASTPRLSHSRDYHDVASSSGQETADDYFAGLQRIDRSLSTYSVDSPSRLARQNTRSQRTSLFDSDSFATRSVACSGWLSMTKQGGNDSYSLQVRKNYQRRYFELRGNVLGYSKSMGGMLEGQVVINDESSVALDQEIFGFHVRTPEGDLFAKADSQIKLEHWMTELHRVKHGNPGTDVPSKSSVAGSVGNTISGLQGWLAKHHPFFDAERDVIIETDDMTEAVAFFRNPDIIPIYTNKLSPSERERLIKEHRRQKQLRAFEEAAKKKQHTPVAKRGSMNPLAWSPKLDEVLPKTDDWQITENGIVRRKKTEVTMATKSIRTSTLRPPPVSFADDEDDELPPPMPPKRSVSRNKDDRLNRVPVNALSTSKPAQPQMTFRSHFSTKSST